jgi:hypothetical protein
VAAAGLGGILWAWQQAVQRGEDAARGWKQASTAAGEARREAQRADEEAGKARDERNAVRREKEHAERMLYFSQVGRADSARLAGNLSEAEQLLESTRADLRGWEYSYMRRLMEGTPPDSARTHRRRAVGLL